MEIQNIETTGLKNSIPSLQISSNKWITCVIFRAVRLIITLQWIEKTYYPMQFINCSHT